MSQRTHDHANRAGRIVRLTIADYADLFCDLTDSRKRREVAAVLAGALGADDLVLFLRDVEVGILLPAPGFAQTLPDGRAWRAFLERCVDAPAHAGPERTAYDGFVAHRLRPPGVGEPTDVFGVASGRDVVLVLLGGKPRADAVATILPLVPLLAHAVAGERATQVAEANTRVARDAASRAGALAGSLDAARTELQHAFDDLRESRQQMQMVNEELERHVEDAHALREELEAANEELQATGGELEAANQHLALAARDADAARQRLHWVLDSLPDGVSAFDSAWRYTYINPVAAEVVQALGHDPRAVIGCVLWDEFPMLRGTKVETETRRAAAARQEVEYEEFLGELDRWYENRIIPTSDGGVIALSRDVTARHQAVAALQAQEVEFRTLAESIPQLTWMARPDGYIFWYNRRWYEYTGTREQDMAGWGWQSVHDPTELPRVLESWRASIAAGKTFEIEFPLRGADGQYRWFLTRSVPVTDDLGAVLRWFGTNTDIQVQRESAAEHARLYAAERAARAEAEAANRVKAEFLTAMSHDLRTPLNAIIGYTDLLEAGVRGPVNAPQTEDLVRIRRASTHLLGLINDILNYAKLEAAQIRFDLAHLSVEQTLVAAAAMIEPQARGKGVTFQHIPCDPACAVVGDRDKVLQIVLNLLNNAVKFTRPGGHITLAADSTTDPLRIFVRDTGRGIPADKLAAVFEPFVQVGRKLSGPEEGSGLGLAISRSLALGMGGDLTVQSVHGEGSTFTLALPRP